MLPRLNKASIICRNFKKYHNASSLSISRTFFGKLSSDKSSSSSSSSSNSSLHTFLLKEGNKNINESALLSISDYDQAISTQESCEAYSKRGWAYFYIKDYEQSMNDVQKAIKLNPRSIEPYCIAASIKIAQNEHHEALEYLKEALDLTSPIDFRRQSIEQVINGAKLSLKVGNDINIDTHSKQQKDKEQKDKEEVSGEIINGEIVNDKTANEAVVDLPFDNDDFMNLQKDLTQQMCNIGGEEFQAKLMKLNEIPAVQEFQRKALKGEKPNYNDYMALMKDEKFKKYNDIMTEISKNPQFANITAKFAAMDWMGAYQELQKDPKALALYMKAFEALD